MARRRRSTWRARSSARCRCGAPFRGVFEKRNADVGQFVNPGDVVRHGRAARSDRVRGAGAPRSRRGRSPSRANARVRLSDGAEVAGKVDLSGRVWLIRRRGSSGSRSRLPNPNNAIPVGRTAEIKIDIGPRLRAQDEPVAADCGRPGSHRRALSRCRRRRRASRRRTSSTRRPMASWVTGLPRNAQLVAEGQDNVVAGLRVTPSVRESAPARYGACAAAIPRFVSAMTSPRIRACAAADHSLRPRYSLSLRSRFGPSGMSR